MPAKGGSKKGSKKGGKKCAKPKPLEGSSIFDDAEEMRQGEDVVAAIVNVIVERGAQVVYLHYMEQFAMEVTAMHLVDNAISACELQLLPHELNLVSDPSSGVEQQETTQVSTGSIAVSSATPAVEFQGASRTLQRQQLWSVEDEPSACVIDRMGRGVVSIKQRPISMVSKFKDALNDASLTKGPQSARSAKSGVSHAAKKKDKAPPKARAAPEPQAIVEEESSAEKETEKMRDTELKRMARKKRLADKQERQKARVAKMAEKQRAVQDSMKGKNYIYDDDGNAILIQTLNPEKLAAIQPTPKVKVSENLDEEDEEAEEGKGVKGTTKVRQGKTKSAGHARRRSTAKGEHYIEQKAGPKMLHHIKMAPGVVLRGPGGGPSTGKDKGNKSLSDIGNLTMKEYNELLDAQQPGRSNQRQPLRPDSATGATSFTSSSPAPSSAPSTNLNASASSPSPAPRADAELPVDPQEVSAPPAPLSTEYGSTIESGKNRSPTKSRLATFDQSNQNDPGWGTKHATMNRDEKAKLVGGPTMSPRDREMLRSQTVGIRGGKKLPKQRPYVEVPGGKGSRERLPKPVYPATSGHGFVTSYLKKDFEEGILPAINGNNDEQRGRSPNLPLDSSGRIGEWERKNSKNHKRGGSKDTHGVIQTTATAAMYFQQQS